MKTQVLLIFRSGKGIEILAQLVFSFSIVVFKMMRLLVKRNTQPFMVDQFAKFFIMGSSLIAVI